MKSFAAATPMTPTEPHSAFRPAEISAIRNEDVVGLHVQDAYFVWSQRGSALRASHYKFQDFVKLENRLEAHLDGLRIAGKLAWNIVAGALGEGKPGTVFVAGVLALDSREVAWIPPVLEAGSVTSETSRGLTSALGWVALDKATGPIRALLASDQLERRRIGLAGAALHRRVPSGDVLPEMLHSEDPPLRARALRTVGELGLMNYSVPTRSNLRSKDPDVRFWAAWSNVLIDGHKEALASLQILAGAGGPYAERAAQMATRRLPPKEAKEWLIKLVKEMKKPRLAIIAAGAFADPEVIPFLLDQMKAPKLARVAGESFSMITGADISYEDLDGEPPEMPEPATDKLSEEDEAAEEADLNLPWPDPVKVQKWWDARKGSFAKGTRYLLGQPISTESLRSALKNGYQRQRAAAAIELAILKPGRPLFEVRAPAWRQQALL